MGRPISTSVTLVAANATNIAQSQSLPGASGLNAVLNGTLVTAGVAVMDAPRRVGITSGGNDSGITFTVTGTARTEQGGIKLVETIAGSNGGVAQTTQDFATVTSVAASGATAGNITIGTTGTGSGPWVPWNQNSLGHFQVSFYGSILSGSPTWQVDYTYDDVFGTWPLPAGVSFPRAIQNANFGSKVAAADGNFGETIRASRLTLTAVGGVNVVWQQQGV